MNKRNIISLALFLFSGAIAIAQNSSDRSSSANAMTRQMVLTMPDGLRFYNTDQINGITIDNKLISISQDAGTDTFNDKILKIAFNKGQDLNSGTFQNQEGAVQLLEARGWLESAFVKFSLLEQATSYHVYYKGSDSDEFTQIDGALVRNYGSYGRADVIGLKADTGYSIKVVPVDSNGNEMTEAATTASQITVSAHNRSGFAHLNWNEGIGAYQNDGTLKTNARVVYITKNNAKTVSLDIVSDSKGKTTTYTGFQQIIYGYQKGYEQRPLAIRLIGTITDADVDEFLSSAEGIQIKGKKANMPMHITIEGVGDDAVTKGFGFLIRNCASIELRNFANMLCMDDAVSIDTDNEHIWVHHLDLFYGKPGGDADQAKGDGTIDLKSDSRYITISYNHLWDSGKASLCGMKSESGPNWITYHHNWFDHSDSRHPRIRTMSVHVWNNYYDGNSKYGVGAAYKSNAFVEANYFRNCKYPMLISKQGSDIATDPDGTFSGEDGGMIKSWKNVMHGQKRYVTYQDNATQFDAYEATSRDEQVPSTVKAVLGGRTYDNFDTDPQLMYSYEPDDAMEVPMIVTGWLGAGRMNHGDFQWQFNNTTEDSNDKVIADLKTAIQNYQSSLVGIFGEENSSGGGDDPNPNPNPGGDEITGETILCTFMDQKPSSDLFTITGNYSNSKGTATIDGQDYTVCLKMESSTSVKFTLGSKMKMTLYFGNTETASVKVDGTKQTASTSTYEQTLEVGAHELTKADSRNLFGIKLQAVE